MNRRTFGALALLAIGSSAAAAQTAQTVPNRSPGDTGDGSATPALAPLAGSSAAGGPALQILVYDNNTQHNLAQQAANVVSPGGVTVADTNTFNGLLGGVPWDAVLVDVPSDIPSGGWGPLENFVTGGGRVVMAYWDWDAFPSLRAEFDVSLVGSISLVGQTLFDSGTSNIFNGVTMPNSDWHNHWLDDGDRFTPQPGAVGLAHIGNPAEPTIVLGNSGRTIAANVLDEAGDTWLADGSAVNIWINMLGLVTTEAACVQRNGTLGLNPMDYTCATAPVIGSTWSTVIGTTPLLGTATLSTHIGFGFGGTIEGATVFGFELLVLPPIKIHDATGTHDIPVPNDPSLAGATVPTQGARIETAPGTFFVVLMNAQDIEIGF